MAKKSSPRDPNLDHPAVKLYIDICHSTPNHFQREMIVAGVTYLELYAEILRKFMSEGRPPQRVDWTLERYRNNLPKVGQTSMSVTAPVTISPEEEAWLRRRIGLV